MGDGLFIHRPIGKGRDLLDEIGRADTVWFTGTEIKLNLVNAG